MSITASAEVSARKVMSAEHLETEGREVVARETAERPVVVDHEPANASRAAGGSGVQRREPNEF